MTEQFVIVGGGLAGAMAAQTLREEGFAGPILLICAEDQRPYDRPPLSKGYLHGKESRDNVFVHSAEWYAEHDVTVATGVHAVAIDRAAHTVATSGGPDVGYTRLLLATGSSPRPLQVPGADLDGLLYLRTLADSDRLAERLANGARVLVVGGGWIGLEVAAAARAKGAHVNVVEATTMPLQRVLGPEVARIFVALHEANGVQVMPGRTIRELRGAGHVESVVLADGTELAADLVVAGIGIWPNVELAVAAGLDVRDGVLTDAGLRTSDPDIFACGDVANSMNPLLGRSIRVEHWANAREGGKAAAKAMLGQEVVYDRVPYFYSDQYDLGMEYHGYAEPGGYDKVVFRGPTDVVDAKAPAFLAFWTSNGRVLAGMHVNVWDAADDIQPLVRAGYAGQAVDLAKLADPGVPLADLLT